MANRKYWIMPFAIFFVALAVVLVSMEGSFVAPFIYSLFLKMKEVKNSIKILHLTSVMIYKYI